MINKKTVKKLKKLSKKMLDLSVEVEYFGGFDKNAKGISYELLMGSVSLDMWIKEIK